MNFVLWLECVAWSLAVVFVVEILIPRVAVWRHGRFLKQRCAHNAVIDSVCTALRPQGFEFESPGTRHTLEPEYFASHARAYALRCTGCGKRRVYVHSFRWWPAR
jgi:hypothetical protein